MNTINLAFKRTFSSGHNLKMALKNIAAGLGASAILIIALFMLFGGFSGYPGLLASLSGGSSIKGSVTIIKDVYPDSDKKFVFSVDGPGNGSTFTLDDDGDNTNTYSNTSAPVLFDVPEIGSSKITVTENPEIDSYNTTWECYYNNDPDQKPFDHGFGKVAEFELDIDLGHQDVTCRFLNILTDAKLTIIKDIIPNSDDLVDFDIFTPNDNEHSNGYDYFSLQDKDNHPNNSSHTTKIATSDPINGVVSYQVGELLGTRPSQNPEFDAKYNVTYECVDANGIIVKSGTTSFIDNFIFAPGDDITCTFINTKNPELIVRKVVDPAPQNNTEGFDFKIEQQRNGIFTKPALFNLSHGESSGSFYPRFDWQQNIKEVLDDTQKTKYWTSYSCKLYDPNGNYIGDDNSNPGEHDVEYNPTLSKGTKADCTFTNHLLEMTVVKKVIDKDGNETTNDPSVFKFKTNLVPNEFSLVADGNPNNSEKKLNFTTNGITIEELLTDVQKFNYSTRYECKDRDGNGINNDTGTKIDITGLTQNSNGIICTFINTELPDAQIFVHKKFQPEDLDDIARVRVYPSGNPTKGQDKEITHDHNQTWDVRPGNVTVHEFQIIQNTNNPIKAYTQSYVCDFLAPSTRPDITSDTSLIDIPGLLSGDRVQCTLINKEVASVIKIVKNVVGSNGADITDDSTVFDFDSTKGTFKLDENLDGRYSSEKTFVDLVPGNYSFSEIVPTGYEASYKCTDDKTGLVVKDAQGNPFEGTGGDIIDMPIVRNQGITCTYTNTKALATIVIKKDVRGPNGDITDDKEIFKIISNTKVPEFFLDDNTAQLPESTESIDVTAGVAYNFTELLNSNQTGEYSVSYKCTDVNQTNGPGATFTAPILGKNESITCTFINTKVLTQIIIKKDVVAEDGTDITDDKEVFNIENVTSNSDFYLDDNSDPTFPNQVVLDVTPDVKYRFLEDLNTNQSGLYTITWECKLNGVVYSSSNTESISISNGSKDGIPKGSTLICVVKNTKKSFNQKITLKKVTKPSGGTTLFPMYIHPEIGVNKTGSIKDGGSLTHTVKADNNITIKELNSGLYGTVTYSCRYIPGNATYHPFSGNGREIPKFFLPKGQDVECTFTNCKQTQTGPGGLLECPQYSDPHVGTGGNVIGGGGGGNQ